MVWRVGDWALIWPLGWAQLAGCRPSFLLEKVASSVMCLHMTSHPALCTCIAHMLFEDLWWQFRFTNQRRFDNELFRRSPINAGWCSLYYFRAHSCAQERRPQMFILNMCTNFVDLLSSVLLPADYSWLEMLLIVPWDSSSMMWVRPLLQVPDA